MKKNLLNLRADFFPADSGDLVDEDELQLMRCVLDVSASSSFNY
ncbi:hypothetical protein [Flavobacterium sp.]